ncbi:hypothetical protein [Lactobacillus delbrueckii]|uniref:hypothetical protein n=1 Tax=Lactobacillus delbrueckii TaxID=1584 RepID=UPI001F29CCC4|nr:hypothetical protein [Lactobacillus delbrueckii]
MTTVRNTSVTILPGRISDAFTWEKANGTTTLANPYDEAAVKEKLTKAQEATSVAQKTADEKADALKAADAKLAQAKQELASAESNLSAKQAALTTANETLAAAKQAKTESSDKMTAAEAAATKAAEDLTSAQTAYDQTAAVYQNKLNLLPRKVLWPQKREN